MVEPKILSYICTNSKKDKIMAAHNELGKIGEKIAQEYLVSKGYTIRHTNWKFDNYELDIVAEKDNTLAIVEVKTRSTDYFGQPEEFVNQAKIRRTVIAAHHYIRYYESDANVRFDIISIIKNARQCTIDHIENAFIPLCDYYQ